jgi:hypothetical protein
VNGISILHRREKAIRGDGDLINISVIGQEAEAGIFIGQLWDVFDFLRLPRHPQSIEQDLEAIVNIATVLDKAAWSVTPQEQNVQSATVVVVLCNEWNESVNVIAYTDHLISIRAILPV